MSDRMVLGRLPEGGGISAGGECLRGGDEAAGGSHWPRARLVSPSLRACVLWTLIRLGWIDRKAGSGSLWRDPQAGTASIGSGC